MRVNLDVPKEQRDLAQRRGAKWDTKRRSWFVEDAADLGPFARWIPKHLPILSSARGEA